MARKVENAFAHSPPDHAMRGQQPEATTWCHEACHQRPPSDANRTEETGDTHEIQAGGTRAPKKAVAEKRSQRLPRAPAGKSCKLHYVHSSSLGVRPPHFYSTSVISTLGLKHPGEYRTQDMNRVLWIPSNQENSRSVQGQRSTGTADTIA
jgi:hypothetical protein